MYMKKGGHTPIKKFKKWFENRTNVFLSCKNKNKPVEQSGIYLLSIFNLILKKNVDDLNMQKLGQGNIILKMYEVKFFFV